MYLFIIVIIFYLTSVSLYRVYCKIHELVQNNSAEWEMLRAAGHCPIRHLYGSMDSSNQSRGMSLVCIKKILEQSVACMATFDLGYDFNINKTKKHAG